MFKVPEEFRVADGFFMTKEGDGCNGVFRLWLTESLLVNIIASDGAGWEHVSVSTANRTLTWEEMCRVKDLFWDKEDAVMQIHPPESDYVNNHPFCLHLWRPIGKEIPLPPTYMVGYKELGTLC